MKITIQNHGAPEFIPFEEMESKVLYEVYLASSRESERAFLFKDTDGLIFIAKEQLDVVPRTHAWGSGNFVFHRCEATITLDFSR